MEGDGNHASLLDSREVPGRVLLRWRAARSCSLYRDRCARALGEGTVFFDEWYEYYIAGSEADLKLQKIYHERSVLVVPCVSSQCGNKPWTRAEREAIRALKMQLSGGNETDRDRILPLRVGDGDVPGIFMNAICPDIRKKPPSETPQLIVNRAPSSPATTWLHRQGQSDTEEYASRLPR